MLDDIKQIAFGSADDYERTRNNVDALLNKEAERNSDPIKLGDWHVRPERFKNDPWVKGQKWAALQSKVAAEVKPTASEAKPDSSSPAGGPTLCNNALIMTQLILGPWRRNATGIDVQCDAGAAKERSASRSRFGIEG